MKQPFNLSIALAVTLSTAMLTVAEADESAVNTKLYFGGKTINSDAWKAQDGHGSVGLLTDFNTGFQGVRIALDLLASGSEDQTTSDLKGTYSAEAHLGLRKYFDLKPKIKPFIGGGVNFAYATQTNTLGSEKTEVEDTSTGFWLNGGVDFLITEQITAGVDVRYAAAKFELADETVELDATALGASLGYRW